MLIVAQSQLIKCGAVVGYNEQDTVIVFHPDLTQPEQERYARELLTPGELALWQQRHRAAS